MASVWRSYEEWVLKGGDQKVQTLATFGQLALGSSDIMEYLWKNEVLTSVVGLLEYVNSLIKQKHESKKPINYTLAAVKVLRLTQKAVEMYLRMKIVGSVHWPWETPKKVLQVIVALEAVKAVLLLKANSHLQQFYFTLRAYGRSVPKGRRSGLRVPWPAEPRTAGLPPVLTIFDVLQPVADTASILRPLLYSTLLLLDHNKGRPWRALSISLFLEVAVFLITVIKGKIQSQQMNRPGRGGDLNASNETVTSRKISRQLSRFRDYLLRDPVYIDYVQGKIAPATNFLQKIPLIGFFVEYYQVRRLLYFDTSGS